MIRMFSGAAHPGSLDFDEFCGLWGFLAAWRELFDRFDEDRSGTISLDEYTKALVAFGYRLTPAFVATLFRAFDRGRSHMGFDLFVQSCISLKRMTDGFKSYDDDRDGYVTLSFEEFLTGKPLPPLRILSKLGYNMAILIYCRDPEASISVSCVASSQLICSHGASNRPSESRG